MSTPPTEEDIPRRPDSQAWVARQRIAETVRALHAQGSPGMIATFVSRPRKGLFNSVNVEVPGDRVWPVGEFLWSCRDSGGRDEGGDYEFWFATGLTASGQPIPYGPPRPEPGGPGAKPTGLYDAPYATPSLVYIADALDVLAQNLASH